MDSGFLQKLKGVQSEVSQLEKEAEAESPSPTETVAPDAETIFAEHNTPGTDAASGCQCAICKAYRAAHEVNG